MVRQKITHCGRGTRTHYREVDIYCYRHVPRSRGKRRHESTPAQMELNNRRSRRYFHQLIKSNFTDCDYRMDLTYDDEHLPASREEAVKLVTNMLKRMARLREKMGLEPMKWICVEEGFENGGRPHHHLIISGGIDRDTLEAMWTKGKGRSAEALGYVRVEHLRFDNEGIEGLVKYITKQTLKSEKERAGATAGQLSLADVEGGGIDEDDLIGGGLPKGKKAWRSSHNLIKPHERTRDNAYSRRDVEKVVSCPPDCEDTRRLFEARYKGYALDRCRYAYNEVLGMWSIRLDMHRKEGPDISRTDCGHGDCG